jgi:hypothetical protein
MAIQIVIQEQDKISSKQKKINKGQRDINGALCYVDWHLIHAVKTLVDELAKAMPQLDLTYIRDEIKKAYYTSDRVADIDPPGCGDEFDTNEEPKPGTKPVEPTQPSQTIKAA